MSKVGKPEEDLVVSYFQDKGFTVLNTNEVSFPDLIIIETEKSSFSWKLRAVRPGLWTENAAVP